MNEIVDWDSHWESFDELTSLNPGQIYRHELILRELNISTTDRVLDIGSGQGDLIQRMLEREASATFVGLEQSEVGIQLAKRKVPLVRFISCDLRIAQSIPDLYGWATKAVCSEVLEHCEEPVTLLKNSIRFIEGGATIVVTVPAGPRTKFDVSIGHLRHYSRDLLHDTLCAAGLEVKEIQAAGFPFFNLYRVLILAMGTKVSSLNRGARRSRLQSGFFKILLKTFQKLMLLNFSDSRLGWQLVAVAKVPVLMRPESENRFWESV